MPRPEEGGGRGAGGREDAQAQAKGPKAWAALKGVHTPATAAVAVVLERQMAALRIDEGEPVEEGVQKFFDLLTRLEGADLNYSDLQKKTKLLALLPDSWSSLIINLNRDLPRLSLEDVKREILQEDFRRRELAGPDGAGVASMGRGHGRGRGRGRGGRFGSSNFNGGRGNGGYGSNNNNNGYGRGRGRFDGECHFCHKTGHMWRDCFRLPDGWTPSQGQEGRGARGGRGRGHGGRGGRGSEAASMKGGDYDKDSSEDRYPGQFFFVSTQATAAAGGVEGFEEPATVGKLGAAGAEYFLTIVDVYTRMTWVYVLPKKSDVAETVKTDWLPMVERQQDRLVKAIRTDRGGELGTISLSNSSC
ncbi:hypothetical protein CLOP_g21237 [Closterium sp. NIES-67]|nr:hypothetical protein CLOP_g21237 [Closterium sp. NIES-67]